MAPPCFASALSAEDDQGHKCPGVKQALPVKALLPEGQAVNPAPTTGPLWSLVKVARTAVPAASGSFGNESGSSLRPGDEKAVPLGSGTRSPDHGRVALPCPGSAPFAVAALASRGSSKLRPAGAWFLAMVGLSIPAPLTKHSKDGRKATHGGTQHCCSHEGAGPLGWGQAALPWGHLCSGN